MFLSARIVSVMAAILCEVVAFVYGACAKSFKRLTVIILLVLPSMAATEPVVIAALGDSLTQGYGLPVGDGFVPQLEGWLKAQGEDVQILNAGVSGDTTAGGLARIDWTLTPDVQGLIVILGGNDIMRGIDPVSSRENIGKILEIASARNLPILLVGMPAPANFGPKYKAQIDAMYPELAAQYGTLHLENFFTPLLAGTEKIPPAKYMQADGTHPNAVGVTKIVESVGPEVQALMALVSP